MRILILKDKDIANSELEDVMREVGTLFSENASIAPQWFVREENYDNLPTETYHKGSDGKPNDGIKKSYLSEKCADVYARWKEEVDFVVFLVHENNWKIKRIWGWNISKAFSGYQVEQVRWDKDNPANSVGTLYHEIHHALDTFIYTYTGVQIRDIVGVSDWDDAVTHGGAKQYLYIRHDENQGSIRAIAPQLRLASKKRKAIFEKRVGIMKAIINALQQVVALQRQLLKERKKDVPCSGILSPVCGLHAVTHQARPNGKSK